MSRSVCRQCGKRAETRVASRSGGGNYRRPHRAYRSRICEPCALRLLSYVTPGSHSVDRWDVLSLERAWGKAA